MIIRDRVSDDMAACVRLLADVHAADGYPLRWPADPSRRLNPHNLLAAWVAEDEHAVIGHVALCSAVGEPSAPLWAAATGWPPEHIGVVARLFVAPSARRRGVGAALLAQVCDEAHSRGLQTALEVLDHDRSAIALYEGKGWRCIASVPNTRVPAGEEQAAMLRCYIAPT
ncbi:MAG: GNAT family N-acetyltransferase [Ktedonobacterales bacterium]